MEYELVNYYTGEPIFIDVRGTGYLEDPIIIDAEMFAESILFKESTDYIILQNCLFDNFIAINKSRNITLNNCGINKITILDSSNCLIERSKIIKYLTLIRCEEITLKDCKITKLGTINSQNNTIINCKFYKKLSKKTLKNNKVEKVDRN